MATFLLVGALTGVLLVWSMAPVAGRVVQVVYPQGTILRFTGYPTNLDASLTVGAPGAVLVGAVHGDHSAGYYGVIKPGTVTSCPAGHIPPIYVGARWNLSFHQELAPGHYYFGENCPFAANVTLTSTLELLSTGLPYAL